MNEERGSSSKCTLSPADLGFRFFQDWVMREYGMHQNFSWKGKEVFRSLPLFFPHLTTVRYIMAPVGILLSL
jgi:hypothetical protein